MAKKKYSFIAEEVYRTRYEVEIDLDEIRKEREEYKNSEDEDILLDIASEYGAFNSNNDWHLDEENIRTIHNETDNEIIYED